MTAADLIRKLSVLPADTEIRIYEDQCPDCTEVLTDLLLLVDGRGLLVSSDWSSEFDDPEGIEPFVGARPVMPPSLF